MFHHRLASILSLIVSFTLTANAESHYTAADFYYQGLQRFAKGDLDRAIADFTKAIEISSRPPADRQRPSAWKAGLDDSSTILNVDQIILIDPLTPLAYSSRAAARGRQGDSEGAV